MNEIREAIFRLEEEIKERKEYIDILSDLNPSDVVTEEKWHSLCETTLRSSDILCTLVSNIFPDAKNVSIYANYVAFDLYDFKCALPTSRCRGIYVDTNWYYRWESFKPTFEITRRVQNRLDYRDAILNKESWLKKAKIRQKFDNLSLNNFGLFVYWFFKWKWEKFDMESVDEEVRKLEEKYKENMAQYMGRIEERDRLVDLFFGKLVPTLSTFSTTFNRYINRDNKYTVDEIRRFERV